MPDQPPTSCCSTCGARLATDTGEGWCPSCAFAAVLTVPDNAEEGVGVILFKAPGHAVLAELGRGATGIVYRARQDSPARDVALKLLRPHEAGSVESRARFRLEAAALADLDHPVILPVFTVGEHDGLPYFTMKLCVGGTLAHRLDRYRGDWRAVAELMATLADGVHYAHSRGVLHRDLKPGNVLFDEAERPFVSDFGLAKLINAPDVGGSVTRPLVVMGTPGYLAPEVLVGGANAATTAADVYALGAILYELLTGAPPAVNGAVKALPAEVPRDLAVICRHSLRAEPGGRYHSVEALASDLRAWLAGRPIAARPQTSLGHAWAWARRNPILAGVSLAAALLLVVVALVATGAAVRLRQEQRATTTALERVRTEAAISQAVTDFLQNDLLAQASPDQQPDRNLTLRAVLDRAAGKIAGHFPGQPLIEAALRETLGATYGSLGDYASMQTQLERAVQLRRKESGPTDRSTLAATARLASAFRFQGRYPQAESLARSTLEAQQRKLGPQHADTLGTLAELARIHREQGQLGGAEKEFLQVIAGQRQTLGPEHAGTLETIRELAFVYIDERKFREAEASATETLTVQKRVLGPEHPSTLRSMETLGGVLLWEEKIAEAEAILVQTLALENRVLGSEHPDTVATLVWLGELYASAEQYAKAEAIQTQAMEIRQRVLGPEHPLTLESRNHVGLVYSREERYVEAEAFLERTVELKTKVLGLEHLDTLADRFCLGTLYLSVGKFSQAEALERSVLEAEERLLGLDHREPLNTKKALAQALGYQGRYAEAEQLLGEVLERCRQGNGPENRQTLETAAALGSLYLLEGKPDNAEVVLAKTVATMERSLGREKRPTLDARDLWGAALFKADRLFEAEAVDRQSLEIRQRLFPTEWQTANIQSQLGETLAAERRFAEAEPLLLAGFAGLKAKAAKIPATSFASVGHTGECVAHLYRAWGKLDKADSWQRKLAAEDKAQ